MSASDIADVSLPMNEEGTKATILKWCKQPGDAVRENEPLLELETDKVTVEVPSPATGVLLEILKDVSTEVQPGQVLARVRLASAATADPSVAAAAPAEKATVGSPRISQDNDRRAQLSPSVRRLLAEHVVQPAQVAGSGRNGRITARDVLRHVGSVPTAQPNVEQAPADSHGPERLPHTPIRRRVAEHMLRSLTEAPHVTTLFEADLTRVLAHRTQHAADFERQGTKLTLTAYFLSACAQALTRHRQLNATFKEDALELHADANIGVGTALGEKGLIVPVLHRAQTLNLFGIATRLGQLVSRARSGDLSPADVRGGTFTISNHGVGGSLLAAPIVINQPQVAILGIGKMERRVCAMELNGSEVIAVRSKCFLTLTIDHRAIDAFQANAFLSDVVKTVEEWQPA